MLRLQALPVSGCMTTKLLLLVSVPTSALVPFAHFASFLPPSSVLPLTLSLSAGG
jgi:hypothetical protein